MCETVVNFLSRFNCRRIECLNDENVTWNSPYFQQTFIRGECWRNQKEKEQKRSAQKSHFTLFLFIFIFYLFFWKNIFSKIKQNKFAIWFRDSNECILSNRTAVRHHNRYRKRHRIFLSSSVHFPFDLLPFFVGVYQR